MLVCMYSVEDMDFDALVLNIIDFALEQRKFISRIDRFPEDVRSCALKFMEFGVLCYNENPRLQPVLEPYLTTLKVIYTTGHDESGIPDVVTNWP